MVICCWIKERTKLNGAVLRGAPRYFFPSHDIEIPVPVKMSVAVFRAASFTRRHVLDGGKQSSFARQKYF